MKYKLIIDPNVEESITIVASSKNDKIIAIEKILETANLVVNGYFNEEIYPLDLSKVICFYTNDNKIYACVENKQYLVKARIYQLEELVQDQFIKLNQGCLANIKMIKKFTPSIGGSLKVVFQNGYEDYVSRRELKNVKRRLGL